MSSDHSDVLTVVHIVVADLHGDPAHGYTDEQGEPVVCADVSVVLQADPIARESAFRAFVVQAAAAMGVPAPTFA